MRRVSLAELVHRSRQALRAATEGIPYFRKLALPSVDRCFAVNNPEAVAFARLCQLLPFSRGDLPAAGGRGNHALRESAESILTGRFDLLGFRQLFFGKPIDWHLEPISGKRSPKVPWSRLNSLSPAMTGDKKVVWELNRHQHLFTLGRAFLETGDESYALALVADIRAWICHNPPAVGINWVSSVDVAFRCISWLWSIAMLKEWKGWKTLPVVEIERSLYLQGRHIESYLSTYFSPNTHLTGEALGLYYLGTCLPELECADRWRSLGRTILLEQLELQVRPDGGYFEQSSWYQRYTADFYFHFLLLAERAGEALPERVSERLCALLDYLMWITRPDGTSPFLGDDDGGRLVKLEERAPNDWRAALSNGAVFFGRGDYKHAAGDLAAETRWLLGSDAQAKFDRISPAPPALTSRAFRDSGLHVMRSGWTPDSNYLLVDCGPHGALNYGHAHADALSIEVAALGKAILVDPGTYTYTGSPEMRDLFRSAAMHNCLTVDGHSTSVPAGPFKWRHVADCAVRCWHDHPRFTYFDGSHDGYRRLRDPVTHSRAILFANREYWIILDRVVARGEHSCVLNYHCEADVTATITDGKEHLEARRDSVALDIVFPEHPGNWELCGGLVSPCYGAKVSAPWGKYAVKTTGPQGVVSVLFPRAHEHVAPKTRSLGLGTGHGFLIEAAGFCDLTVISGTAAPDEGLRTTDFEWSWVRRTANRANFERAVLVHGSRFANDDFDLVTEHPVSFVAIARHENSLSIDISPAVGVRVSLRLHADRVVINGRAQVVNRRGPIVAETGDAPGLQVESDPAAFCNHVRH